MSATQEIAALATELAQMAAGDDVPAYRRTQLRRLADRAAGVGASVADAAEQARRAALDTAQFKLAAQEAAAEWARRGVRLHPRLARRAPQTLEAKS